MKPLGIYNGEPVNVLMDSIANKFGSEAENKFQVFYRWGKDQNTDLSPEDLKKLRGEVLEIRESLSDLELGVLEEERFRSIGLIGQLNGGDYTAEKAESYLTNYLSSMSGLIDEAIQKESQ